MIITSSSGLINAIENEESELEIPKGHVYVWNSEITYDFVIALHVNSLFILNGVEYKGSCSINCVYFNNYSQKDCFILHSKINDYNYIAVEPSGSSYIVNTQNGVEILSLEEKEELIQLNNYDIMYGV